MNENKQTTLIPENPIIAKILVVDDERDMAQFIKDTLECEGYKVITAGNGFDAVESISEERPDFLILDGTMPLMDGITTLNEYRDNRRNRGASLMMITDKSNDHDIWQAWTSGVDVHLTKPSIQLKWLIL